MKTFELAPYRRGRGRIRRFGALLPLVRVSTRTNVALCAMAGALGVSIPDVVREAISTYTGIPVEEPNIDNIKEK